MRRSKEELQRVSHNMFNVLELENVIKPFEFRTEGDSIIYNDNMMDEDLDSLSQQRGDAESKKVKNIL
ncbi:hypothetical protein ABID23_001336 [Bartonella silvatica]|uniref:Uncharacterized protein n=1 Tax=Bartonella silvatica TaxID=357760 RepID=A0ABV2HI50_9HYPH